MSSVSIPQHDGPAIRGRIGVVPQEDNHDTELTVWDNLLIYGRYFDLPRPLIKERAEELFDFVQLTDRRDSKVDPLSGGMKRRLTIARALINQPELLLLDEPTTGLDPQARHLVWERLYRLKQAGTTLVLTTHYMDEAEQLCDRLVIMDGGRIVAEGSPRDLIDEHVTREVVEVRFDSTTTTATRRLAEARGARRAGRAARRPRRALHRRRRQHRAPVIDDDGMRAASVLVRRASLEDVFLILTGRTLEEGVSSPTRIDRDGDAADACASSSASGRCTGGCGAASRSPCSSARCCSSRRWASASAAWSTRARARSTGSRTSTSSRRAC